MVVQPGTSRKRSILCFPVCRKEHTAEDRDVVGSNPTHPIRLKLLNVPEIFNTEEGIEDQGTGSRPAS